LGRGDGGGVVQGPGGKWPDKAAECTFREGHALREYQREGVNWLVFNWYARPTPTCIGPAQGLHLQGPFALQPCVCSLRFVPLRMLFDLVLFRFVLVLSSPM
jgi:hypothetical protein